MRKKGIKYNQKKKERKDFSQLELERLQAKYPNYRIKSNILGVFFFISLVLTVWEINIYRKTFISVYVLLAIWIVTGLIITPFFKNYFNIYCFNSHSSKQEHTPIGFHFLYNIITFGGLLIFSLMFINYHLANPNKKGITMHIINSGHLAKSRNGCADAFANIVYENLEKQLIFPCTIKIEKYNAVALEIQKGFLGFDIIINQTPINSEW